ncbi:MAG: sulfite exporter TauE/SafE family protein [Actinobacteria bacterium]|nr:sulfite exporter TauE/SafE family protein [Actinomycetota bacterium]
MDDVVVVAIAGFCASMVDGALGMGFGPTSTSILLSQGLSPATVSTTVNLAKVATGFAAGVSHWRFNNIDRRLVVRLAIPGAIGALIGVTVLASVDGDDLKPYLAGLLLIVGIRILFRFSRPLPLAPDTAEVASDEVPPTFDEKGVEIAATAGGITNGMVGAWGPVVTPYLLHRGLSPRFAVGSVNTAEVAVAVVAAGSLVASLGGDGLDAEVVLAMLAGGVLAAPLAAYVVRFLPARLLGLAVAALLLITNIRELVGSWDMHDFHWVYYAVALVLIALAGLRPRIGRALAGRRATS